MMISTRRNLKALTLAMLSATAFSGFSQTVYAEVKLPSLLSDGAIIQRDQPIPIWGTTAPNTSVQITLGSQIQTVQSNASGDWRTVFPAVKGGTELTLAVHDNGSTQNTVKVHNIVAGDVWVASGQSNMEWIIRDTDNAAQEVAAANHALIRQFKVPRTWSLTAESTLAEAEWVTATPGTLSDFSAVGWYFAKSVHNKTGVPIAILNSTWGGSSIEAWMSPEALGTTAAAAQKAIQDRLDEGERRAVAVRDYLKNWPGALDDGTAANHAQDRRAELSSPQLNDQNWHTHTIPGLWEEQKLPNVDGVIWYRTTFTLSEQEAAQDVILGLGRIDDQDITWVNGHVVGETLAHDRVREYTVPAHVLKPGKNQIAIRVLDGGGGGGLYSDADLFFVKTQNGNRYSLAGQWKFQPEKVTVSLINSIHHTPTALYNKMLHPLFQMPVKGVIWYQGESNAGSAEQAQQYAQQFPTLIQDWRKRWQQPDMPFYWVQLASFISGGDRGDVSPWAILRHSQTATLSLPHTGQAISIDVGNPHDIHPTDKKTVGERLARIALNQTYGFDKEVFRGPIYQSHKKTAKTITLQFTSAGKLQTHNQDTWVHGFAIASKNGAFEKIKAKIVRGNIVIDLPKGKSVSALRYAWSDNPEEANLSNSFGLPAEPFEISF